MIYYTISLRKGEAEVETENFTDEEENEEDADAEEAEEHENLMTKVLNDPKAGSLKWKIS